MSAVQKEAFPLAGLLTNVNPENLKKPETTARSLLSIVMVQNLAELSHNLTEPHFVNLTKPDIETVCYFRKLQFWNQAVSGIGITQNLTKQDIRSAENLADWLSKVVTENLSKLDIESAGMLTNVDIGSGEMMTNDDMPRLCEDKNVPSSQEFSDSIKKGLQSHCPSIYGYRAPAKSGAGISLPEMIRATHDAPSVFFCVVNSVHPFFSDTVIIRAARKIMVGCVGASSEAPGSLITGKANPAQFTTRQISLCGGGYIPLIKEAATWLLPSPKNRLSSGVFIPASNLAISLYLLLLNQKPAPCYPTARACSLPVFVQGVLMLNHFIVYGYGVNQRGMAIGINHKTHAESEQSARAAAMLKAQDSGLSLIRITRVQEVAA